MLRDPAAEEDKHYVGFVAAVASQDALAGSLAQFADAIQAAYTAEGPHLQWRDRSSRKKLAFELLMKAAKAQARGNLNTLDTPYYEPGSDVAQKSARWLATASTMISGDREPLDNQQFRDLRYLQVLATFYASPDDKETAQQVANRTDALIDADKRYDPPIQVLLVHARSHAVLRNLPQMAGAYAMLYDACRMVPKESAPKPHEVDAHVLAPAIALLDADGISKLDEQGKVAAARLFAARGRYAHLHPSVQARVQAELKQATTSDVNVPKKAYEWFDAAVTLDPRRAEYYYGRGYACDLRHDLSYAERALRMEQNAAEAVAPGREPKDFPAADGLRGLALFYKSLTLADYDEKRAAASV
jgi:hypothetical protein